MTAIKPKAKDEKPRVLKREELACLFAEMLAVTSLRSGDTLRLEIIAESGTRFHLTRRSAILKD